MEYATRRGRFVAACVTALIFLAAAGAQTASDAVRGYIRDVPSESPAHREARHKRVAERRAGPVIICHRGGSSFAPENTLEAFASAMDYGADGVEVDIQRTADNVLVCFHDSALGRQTDGFGPPDWYTYCDLLQVKFRPYGTATSDTRIPTFAALVELARQRSMLIWLDIKVPGAEDEIARILDEADAWDHVINAERYNSEKLHKNPKLIHLHCLKWLFEENHADWDPKRMASLLPPAGKAIMVDDPRVAVRALGRTPYAPVPLPQTVYADWQPADPPKDWPADYLYSLNRETKCSEPDLLKLLEKRPLERTQLGVSESYQRLRSKHILARAWAAWRLAETKCSSAQAVELLEYQVTHRSLNQDWFLHGLDGVAAAMALGRLGSEKSVPVLVEALEKIDPALKPLAQPGRPQEELVWRDYSLKTTCARALGDLRCAASKRALSDCLSLSDAEAGRRGLVFADEVADSLLRQELTRDEVVSLLKDRRADVRIVALRFCLDHPSKERDEALKIAAPWALELPRARS
jgi:glycerophosphoryl diester phosphodiesterase